MLPTFMVVGGFLGVWLGAVARARFHSRRWPDFKRLALPMAVIMAAAVIGLFAGEGSRLPQLCGYLVSLLTGFMMTTTIEAAPGVSEWTELSLPPSRKLPRPAAEVTPLADPVEAASRRAEARAT